MPLVRVQVLVDEGFAAALAQEAAGREVPVSQVARKLLQLGWAAHGQGWRPAVRAVGVRRAVEPSTAAARDDLEDIA